MTNVKIRILEDILDLEHKDYDAMMISFYDGEYSCSYVNIENGNPEIKENNIELTDVPSIIAFNYCTGLDLINDLEGTNFLYNSKNHRKVLGFSLLVPMCTGSIIYNDEVVNLNFAENLEKTIRKSFKTE